MIDISVRENIELKGKTVAVIGAGKSGAAAARLLIKKEANALLSDQNESPLLTKDLSELEDWV